ncbi:MULTISPECIES: response regulator [Altibacter]|uniref:tetratricopeptide repeat-containing hybrid sensor histidine kinase/response regulator n=1 Tax=Altibacter TaxID=1535231 RepID=UPI0006913577|nr:MULTISPECIES: response regulator [Altibacter]MCW9036485.1 response regulator [Altibacter sp.]
MKKYCYFLLLSVALFSAGGVSSLYGQTNDPDALKNKKERFKMLMDSSNIHYNNGDYRKDLALNFDLLELAFEINEPYYIHKGYRNLAYDYLVLGDTLLAKESFEKAEKQALLSKNDTVRALTYMDLANIYTITGSGPEAAFDYHDKSIDLFEKLEDSAGLAKAHYNVILTALEVDELTLAYTHIIKARKLIPFGDASYAASLDNLMGQYHYYKENYEMANTYFKKAIAQAEKEKHSIVLEDAYYYYSESLLEQGNYKDAFTARQEYEDYLSINQQKIISSNIEAVSTNHIVKEYRTYVQQAEEKAALQAEIVANKSTLNNVLLIAFCCFLVLFVVLFLAFRNRKQLINELKLKNQEYLKAKEEAEQLSQAKNKFFSTISHELRTPLYGVIGLTTILLEDASLKKHLKDLKSLKFSADYLLALINDVLHINKIESQTLENEFTAFNLRDLIKKISSSFEYMRVQNNNEIHIHISESVPEVIYGNSVRLSQVLMNLIANACKFTENGDIYVIAETTKNTPDTAAIKFYIRDTGIGIPSEKQEHIFEEFSQLNTDNYKYHGTGLGLPIVKKLLQMDQAEITLKSDEGKGSLFVFTIEYKIVYEEEVQNKIEEVIDVSLLKGKHILVVEDNRINQTVTKKILEKNDMHCSIAENGQIAIDALQNTHYDLILMDINMPIMNGIDATKEIRKFNTTIPILALTAVEVEEIRHSIFECGMNDIIVKPYDITRFIQTIYRNLTDVNISVSGTPELKAM